jgi:Xaa-Pro aminopeptidase
MKHELEALMKQQGVDAIWISGPAQHNPPMVYLTGGAHITNADLIKMQGKLPFLCHDPMERDEAAKSGYPLINTSKYDYKALLKEADDDPIIALALRFKMILTEFGLTKGRVMLYGTREVGNFYSILSRLQKMMPELEISGDGNGSILLEARATKDAVELERIHKMGQLTIRVVGNTADFLSSHSVKQDVLMKADDTPLTIGDVKKRINLWIAELGGENPEDTIFAIGRDAGVPHSTGSPTDLIRLGQTIVYDIFPCEAGGGYYYDFTRTWSLGYAPDKVCKLYEQVKTVYDSITREVKAGVNVHEYQEHTCDLFENMGHPTVRKDPQTVNGYVHSLGHGVGLNIHEKPFCNQPKDDTQILKPGSVFTIEPGLYYSDEGMGVRLEDTWYMNSEGTFGKFVDYPMDLVLPVKGG